MLLSRSVVLFGNAGRLRHALVSGSDFSELILWLLCGWRMAREQGTWLLLLSGKPSWTLWFWDIVFTSFRCNNTRWISALSKDWACVISRDIQSHILWQPSAHPSYSHYYLLSPSTLFFFFCTSYCFLHILLLLFFLFFFFFAHPFCTSYCLFAHRIVFLHILLFCTFFISLHILLLFLLFLPHVCPCVMLLYIICILIILHCPLSGPDSITFHF